MVIAKRHRHKDRWASGATFVLVVCLALVGTGAIPAVAAPSPWPLPGADGSARKPASQPARSYTYESVDSTGGFRTLPEPDLTKPNVEAELAALGSHDDWAPGDEEHLLTAWRDYKARAGTLPWKAYVRAYIRALDNGRVGAAFEAKFYADEGIDSANGWLVNGKIPGIKVMDPKAPGKEKIYRVDGYLTGSQPCTILELKSGAGIRLDQLKVLVDIAQQLGCRIVFVFGKKPTKNALDTLATYNTELAKKIGGKVGQDAIVARRWDATAQPKTSTSTAAAGGVAAGKQLPATSAASEATAGSPTSPEEAAEAAKVVEGLTEELEQRQALPASAPICHLGKAPCRPNPSAKATAPAMNAGDVASDSDPLGGVDFSTLELRYISDTYRGTTGMEYAYRVDPAPGQKVSYGGADAAQLASDSFFVWLALPASSFTVNLNPEEPDRIIDAQFGKTDAGRVLLEADLQMKKTVAKLIHPDTPQGLQFWKQLQGDERCISMRQWIVPAPATVRDNGNELFILDAPLRVKMETEYLKATGAEQCPGQAKSDTAHNETVFRTQILPQVEKAVNTAPEYADLRRVYASRVAAQWYRERSAKKHTAYADLIDKGDVTPWPLQKPWTPREVFDRYVKSYRDGEFKIEHTTQSGDTILTETFIYGGVDFTNIPRTSVSSAEFASKHPTLKTAVSDALSEPVTEDGTKEIWLGGQSTEIPLAEASQLPPSPLSMPLFYVLTALPVAAWLLLGALLFRRQRSRRAVAPTMTAVTP